MPKRNLIVGIAVASALAVVVLFFFVGNPLTFQQTFLKIGRAHV